MVFLIVKMNIVYFTAFFVPFELLREARCVGSSPNVIDIPTYLQLQVHVLNSSVVTTLFF